MHILEKLAILAASAPRDLEEALANLASQTGHEIQKIEGEVVAIIEGVEHRFAVAVGMDAPAPMEEPAPAPIAPLEQVNTAPAEPEPVAQAPATTDAA